LNCRGFFEIIWLVVRGFPETFRDLNTPWLCFGIRPGLESPGQSRPRLPSSRKQRVNRIDHPVPGLIFSPNFYRLGLRKECVFWSSFATMSMKRELWGLIELAVRAELSSCAISPI